MDAFGAFGELPFATLRDADVGATGLAAFYFSDAGHITEATEVPASTYFEARLMQPLSFQRSLRTADGFAGRAADGNGIIEIANHDGYLDSLIDGFAIDGRQVKVMRRALGGSFADAETIFDGTAPRWEAPEGMLRIPVRDNLHRLSVTLRNSASGRYLGTGGTDGGADLKGKPIPICLGKCLNVQLVLVDATNLIYQVHGGRIKAFTAVYDSGDLLSEGVNYTTDLTTGRITLLSAPVGLITADVEGSMAGGVYVDTTATIIRRLWTEHAGLESSMLDTGSFDNVEAANSATVGLYIGPEDTLAIDAIEALLVGIGGYLECDRVGRISMGVFGATWYGATFDIDETAIASIARVALPTGIDPPNKRRQVAYQRLWSGPQATDLAGIVTAARRSFLALPYRTAEASGDASGASILATDPPPVMGLFDEEAGAKAEAKRLIALYGVPRALYRVTLNRGLWAFQMNMTGTLRYPAWNLDNGAAARVVAIRENAAAGTVELDLFV